MADPRLQPMDCLFCGGKGWYWTSPVNGIQDKETCGMCRGHGRVHRHVERVEHKGVRTIA